MHFLLKEAGPSFSSTVKRTPTNRRTEWIEAKGLNLGSRLGQTRDQLIVYLHQTWPIKQLISHFLFCLPNAWYQWYALRTLRVALCCCKPGPAARAANAGFSPRTWVLNLILGTWGFIFKFPWYLEFWNKLTCQFKN